MIIGPLLVIGYNAELFGGLIHTDLGFASAWGVFPALTGYVGQAGRLAVAPVLIAGAAMVLSAAQRHLSTPARMLRGRKRSCRQPDAPRTLGSPAREPAAGQGRKHGQTGRDPVLAWRAAVDTVFTMGNVRGPRQGAMKRAARQVEH
jgi:hypothetical protein